MPYTRKFGRLRPPMKLNVEYLIRLDEALEHLDGVKIDAALHVLTAAHTRANLVWNQPVRIKEQPLDRWLFDELFVFDKAMVPHCTPRGAETLIYLYEANELPLVEGAVDRRVSEGLRIYVTKGPELLAEVQPKRAQFPHT